MSDSEAFVYEIAALLIADIKTSGACTQPELKEACRAPLRRLLGDREVPKHIAVLMPVGMDRWPQVFVNKRGHQDY